MIQIDVLMQKFCEAGSYSVQRYVEVSGVFWRFPEYVMPTLVMDRLGDEVTITLETNFADLLEWNAGARTRLSLPPPQHDPRLLRIAQALKRNRVDMALFEGEEDGKPKDEQNFFALAEFKSGWIDAFRGPGAISDRDKLLMLLEHVDTCPWGIICGWAAEVNWLSHKNQVQGTQDRCYEASIVLPQRFGGSYVFYAQLFERGSDPARLAEILKHLPDPAVGLGPSGSGVSP